MDILGVLLFKKKKKKKKNKKKKNRKSIINRRTCNLLQKMSQGLAKAWKNKVIVNLTQFLKLSEALTQHSAALLLALHREKNTAWHNSLTLKPAF